MKAYKKSLLLDGLCIFISVVVLYCAHKELLDMWALIVGACVAFGFLAAALVLFFKARRLFKEEAKAEQERLMKAQKEVEAQEDNEEKEETSQE